MIRKDLIMNDFQFFQPTRIHFGTGKLARLGKIAREYGDSCLLVTTSREEDALKPLYARAIDILSTDGVTVHHFDEVVPNPTISGIEKAIALFQDKQVTAINRCDFTISAKREEIPTIIHQLVANDVDLYQVKTKRQTLEDFFLSVTGVGEDD